MRFTLINSGYRKTMFTVRTVLTYAEVLLLGIFMIVSLFTPGMFIVYVAYTFMACVFVSIVLTIVLAFPKTYGTLRIDPDSVKIITSTHEIELTELTILLNASEFEISEAKRDAKKMKFIPMTGHYLASQQLPELQPQIELMLTPDDKITLINLEHPIVTAKPQFQSRPGLRESPSTIIITLLTYRSWR